MADNNYANWRARLAGEKVTTFLQPQVTDCGYYRKPITEALNGPNGKTSGRKRIIGWIPVAYYVDQFLPTVLRGLIGAGDDMRDLSENEVADEQLWSWCVSHPIPYEVYKAVAEDGEPWADGLPAEPKEGRVVSDNAGPPAEEPKEKTIEDYRVEIKAAIDAAVTTVGNTEEAAMALGSKNRLSELRLAADKAGKAVYEPHYRLYKAAYDAWTPMVKAAIQREEKVERALLMFREAERSRAAQAAAMAAQARIEEEQRNARAADRAIARGEPEPEPEFTEEAPPATAAALQPVVPTYGTRKLKEELKTFVTIVEPIKVATHFMQAPELMAILQTLAERAVKRGEIVPGITTREGLV